MSVLTPFFQCPVTYLLLESRYRHEDVMLKFADMHLHSLKRLPLLMYLVWRNTCHVQKLVLTWDVIEQRAICSIHF